MKKRYLYTLLFCLPGALLSFIAATLALGTVAGFFWIFLFGDNTWPEAARMGLTAIYVIIFVGGWLGSLLLGYKTGKKLEAEAGLNKKHVLASIALTFIPLLIIVLHQLSVGNIGPQSDMVICGDFCLEKGYSASGMPPEDSGDRSCICYDSGTEVIKVPMEELLHPKAR